MKKGEHPTPAIAECGCGQLPDANGYFAKYGGSFVPETLIPCLAELEAAFRDAVTDPSFIHELSEMLQRYVGRPSPLYPARRLSEYTGGCRIFLKREDLNHTGSHKINNTLAQAMLARRMGKLRLIAETGAGQHGVATATAAALFGLKCTVYMGAEDAKRQRLNVFRMKTLGAEVRPVEKGSQTLKDATNEAFRDYIANYSTSHMVIGSVVGPHPYPMMVREFQSVIGRELMSQSGELLGKFPDCIVACVGGGSNAMGVFYPFLNTEVDLVGVEGGGKSYKQGENCATLAFGTDGVLHGALSKLLQDEEGQILSTHSLAAGLDYPGVGPEHAFLKEVGRVKYENVSDQEALNAFVLLSRLEGIVPALESAHAVAWAVKKATEIGVGKNVVVNLSGRGDKDVETISALLGVNENV